MPRRHIKIRNETRRNRMLRFLTERLETYIGWWSSWNYFYSRV